MDGHALLHVASVPRLEGTEGGKVGLIMRYGTDIGGIIVVCTVVLYVVCRGLWW